MKEEVGSFGGNADSSPGSYEPRRDARERCSNGSAREAEITTYMYSTHAITDDASGAYYALGSESLYLDAYMGNRSLSTESRPQLRETASSRVVLPS